MNRALLVGINKYPSQPLNGCVNDIQDMAKFLNSHCGFDMNDIRLLVDERATTAAICERLGWLLTGLRSGDRVVFHYSGHGVQLPTRNPQGEVDRLDEAICPVDFDWTDEHSIRDKDFHKIFLSIPTGVEFLWISDSCHSGDLTRELLKETPDKRQSKTMIAPADIQWRIDTAKRKGIKPLSLTKAATELNLAFISGCRSDQTSSDAYFGNKPNGALTYYLLDELNKRTGLTIPLTKLVVNINSSLATAHYDQQPQLEGNMKLRDKPFLAIDTRSDSGKFLVDLGNLSLTEEQEANINRAIQTSVSGELGKLGTKEKISLVPLEESKGFGDHDGITMGFRAV